MSMLVFVACLMGAAGVALMAASAHGAPGSGLDSAGSLLLFHAASVIAIVHAPGDVVARGAIGGGNGEAVGIPGRIVADDRRQTHVIIVGKSDRPAWKRRALSVCNERVYVPDIPNHHALIIQSKRLSLSR